MYIGNKNQPNKDRAALLIAGLVCPLWRANLIIKTKILIRIYRKKLALSLVLSTRNLLDTDDDVHHKQKEFLLFYKKEASLLE